MPFDFILDFLYPIEPVIRKMFGVECLYINDKLYFACRLREKTPEDNGIWIGTEMKHHEHLQKEFPSLTSLRTIPIKKWLLLPDDVDDFEETVAKLCDLVKANDPRIGVLPKPKKKKKR